jgi:hypothetical protein|tara:strand:+ start:1000 stop:1686 length:687 start_codon:yes stop_codon:yes gene_type:complete
MLSTNPKVVTRTLLMEESTYATVLLLILLDTYGPEALQWAPETISLELKDDYAVNITKQTLDKIMAAIAIVTTNYFYKDVLKFIELANILSGDDAEPDEFDPATAGEVLWGLSESFLLWPPEKDDNPEDTQFSPEVTEYMVQVLQDEGYMSAPDLLALSGHDTSNFVRDTWSDDPEMYQAIYEMQQQKVEDLKASLQDNFKELFVQLKLLPVKSGNKEDIMRKITNAA